MYCSLGSRAGVESFLRSPEIPSKRPAAYKVCRHCVCQCNARTAVPPVRQHSLRGLSCFAVDRCECLVRAHFLRTALAKPMPKDLSSEDIRHFPLNLSGLHLHKNSADPFPPSALSYPVVFPLPSSYIPVASNLEDRAIATPEVVRRIA